MDTLYWVSIRSPSIHRIRSKAGTHCQGFLCMKTYPHHETGYHGNNEGWDHGAERDNILSYFLCDAPKMNHLSRPPQLVVTRLGWRRGGGGGCRRLDLVYNVSISCRIARGGIARGNVRAAEVYPIQAPGSLKAEEQTVSMMFQRCCLWPKATPPPFHSPCTCTV